MKQKIWMLPDKSDFLRQRTTKLKTIGSQARQLAEDFFDTWDTVAAYGIAAPQIGSSLRSFIWKGKDMEAPEVIYNPKIIRAYGELKDYDGCLSVPGVYCPTRRAEVVELTGLDAEGRPIRRKYEGFDARIIQHEVDHLDGVLFIDRIDDLSEAYTLKEGPEDEEGDVTYIQVPDDEEIKAWVERFRRPLPGYALVW
ncbi:peptide deformylase [Sulfobacillus acidophilus DSM 10332]|uniref:Peptide deformylase n=1 Tax=Sulfobacillus acidophilus (strain ATCC 700253 / DSM 10332 / NAL) TaxID=679936 RepID=G8TSD2_SULAD|nr:peptide deformylase [Sulfobacillus acidophilus DSM 10332]